MRNKKILNLLIFMLGIFLISSTTVLAEDVSIKIDDSPNGNVITKDLGTSVGDISAHVKKATTGEILYCSQYALGNPGMDYTWNCNNKITKNKEELLYVLNQEPKNAPADFNTTEQDKFFIKQMVVWRYTEPGPDLFTGFDYNRDSISKAIQSMINAADTYKNKKYDIALTIEGSKTMSLTSDRKYYVSSKINLGGTNLSGNISVSVNGVNGAFVTSDVNATSGNTSFESGTKVYVKVPASNITKTSTIKLTANGNYIRYIGDIYNCTPGTGDTGIQNVLHYKPQSETKTISDAIDLNVTLTNVTISKQDITFSKELPGATLVIKQGNNIVKKWVSTTIPETFQLAPGTYTLEESIAPSGYIKSTEKIEFTVTAEGKVTIGGKEATTPLVMQNKPIMVYISKKSINGKTELPGAKLKITDKEGKLVKDLDGNDLEWTSTTKEKSFHLAAGTYYLTETIAPDGYELSDTIIEFIVTEDGKVKMDKKDVDGNLIVFTNTPAPEEVKTGSFILYIVVIGIISVGLVTYYVMKKQEA